MKKRIKSFLITSFSLLGTAFFAVIFTPEFSAFLQLARETLASWGVPVVVIGLIGVFISELWKQILNNRTIKSRGMTVGSSYNDYENRLY